jgi:glucosyl-dolichyl phosphate glucuronosyltransferase
LNEPITASVVIATYNRSLLLADTLRSLSEQPQNSDGLEVIVVNNNSSDDTSSVTASYKSQLPRFRLVLELNQGLSYARNRGVREAKGEIVIFLDDDVELAADWLTELLAPFRDPAVAVSGGKVMPFGMQAFPEWLPREYGYLVSIFDPADSVCEIEKVMGANFAVRRQVFDEVGLFDVKLGRKGSKLLGGEEVELFKRIRDAGYKIVYTPNSVVWHKIAEKLKPEYIETYAYWLGVSEAHIDKSVVSRLKYWLKLLRSRVWPCSVYRLQRMFSGSDAASAMRYVIKRNYARGYIEHEKAMAEIA